LEYFRANAWNNRQRERHQDRTATKAWEQPELEEQLLHLRRAVNHAGLDKLKPIARCQVLDHRGGNLDLAGMLGWAKLQDITVVWKRHGCTREKGKHSGKYEGRPTRCLNVRMGRGRRATCSKS
jgi:hypothetical protein